MRRLAATWAFGAIVASLAARSDAGPLTLAENGRSAYQICSDSKAPASIRRAAHELRRILEVATGAKLPIAPAPATPMICLGVNASSREAGLDKDLPEIGKQAMAAMRRHISAAGE